LVALMAADLLGLVVVELTGGGVTSMCLSAAGTVSSCVVLEFIVLPSFNSRGNSFVIGLVVVRFAVRIVAARIKPSPPTMRSSITSNLHE